MATGLHSWNATTAASNANADENINWAEGMAPSSVNDSARAMMMSAAMWRDDTNGSLTTGGSSTAYTVTSNQGFASLAAMNTAVIAFVPHATNGDAPTLSVDGLTAKKIRFRTGADIPSNSLFAGTPYVVTYYNAVGEFVLHGLGEHPYGIPLCGGLDYWASTTPNSAFVFPVGQAVSRTTYATAFAKMGTAHGEGDGSTTFNLPDKRGRVSAGKDNMGGTSADRLVPGLTNGIDGDVLGATGGSDRHGLLQVQLPTFTPTGDVTVLLGNDDAIGFAGARTDPSGGSFNYYGPNAVTGSIGLTGSFSGNSIGGGEAHNNVQPTIICNYILRII